MRNVIEVRADLPHALEEWGEPGAPELCQALPELGHEVVSLRRLKSRVYRLELGDGAPWRSVVLKRLAPDVAEGTRLLATRWLPALGLGDRCPRLLRVAAERGGRVVWHVYEDLGGETLAVAPAPEVVEAAVDLVTELHTRAARHPILPEARRYGGDLGMHFFLANLRDAIAALEALAASAVEPPPEHAEVPARLLQRLAGLRADAPRRAAVFEAAAGPDTLLHGDLWPVNFFVHPAGGAGTPRARLVDWDLLGVGPASYDLSTLLYRFPGEQGPAIVERYRDAAARAGRRLAPPDALAVLCETAELARYTNRVIWPALALIRDRADWGFPELAEVERWFEALDSTEVVSGGGVAAVSGRRSP